MTATLRQIIDPAGAKPARHHRHAAMSIAVIASLALVPAMAAAQKRRVDETKSAPRVFRDCPTCPEMVIVPAGEYMMGSPESERGRSSNEGPQRKVSFKEPFAIGKYEVTFAQWDACVAEGGCQHKPGDEGWGRGKRPVISVSWQDAMQYVAWLSRKTGKSYRLPTEAEWEYTARGVTKASDPHPPFSTGTTINYKQANYDANFTYVDGKMGIFRQKTMDVGSFHANAFGIHDMHGNVWEWVQDCYKETYKAAPADGSAVKSAHCPLRILRGGSWNYHPRYLRSAYRYATAPEVRLDMVGFRVASAPSL
jgi:formylglycine-generating enzyme required for sulfatase activity